MLAQTDVPLDVASSGLTGAAIVVRVLSVLALIGINAFFVAAEFSIVSVRRSRINQLAEAGDIQARTVQSFQRSLDRLLSTTQIGITLSSLALGWIGESTIAAVLLQLFRQVSFTVPMVGTIAHSIAIPLAFIAIAYLQIVLGELSPKAVAMLYPEQLARLLGPPSLTIAKLFMPFVWVLNQSTRWLLRVFGIQYTGSQSWYSRVTPEELQLIIRTSTESPGLDEEERELLNNVFEFRDVTAGEVMIPRTQITALAKTCTLQEVLDTIAETGYSQFPVVGESLDDVSGILSLKDLIGPLARHEAMPGSFIESWVRPARFVPEYTQLHDLLQIMQKSGKSMVMVVDEFGGTAGLLTLTDVTGEIIGDSHELEEDVEVLVSMLDDQSYRVKAQTYIEEVNELLGVELPAEEDYQTLAGFLIHQLQKIPNTGDRVYYSGYEWTVTNVDGPKVLEVKAKKV
ncbi:hemolysin family protein [Oscillatoria sp. CS-180]|uniref:hemolysin family protein n=1 Tax=Oscillatoria sp. CS-180 TaxID=3021720 RepID=UPI00232C26E1|nr:hemolysin family protein [Oscillatoria sp. CS-180]MDB9527771.1 hemolysin family protein [Oscillatoria sp. CS-180]